MGALDDPATREAAIKIASQIAGLALESIQGRKLRKAEEAALLAAVRKIQAEREFTLTDEILGGRPKNPAASDTPDEHS